jgi:hypothetical protein
VATPDIGSKRQALVQKPDLITGSKTRAAR